MLHYLIIFLEIAFIVIFQWLICAIIWRSCKFLHAAIMVSSMKTYSVRFTYHDIVFHNCYRVNSLNEIYELVERMYPGARITGPDAIQCIT